MTHTPRRFVDLAAARRQRQPADRRPCRSGRRPGQDSSSTSSAFGPATREDGVPRVRRPGRPVRGRQPGHRHRRPRVRLDRPHVHRGARRRHAAGRVHHPVHRRQVAHRAGPAGRHHGPRRAPCPTPPSSTPTCWRTAQDANGHIFGLPRQAYGIGLQYNRDLFTQAGLDPDKPPTTWDEVRADAKAIADKTGQAGYVQMSQSNTGGWQIDRRDLRARRPDGRGRRGRHASPRPSTTRAPRPPSSSSRPSAGRTTAWAPTSCSTGAPPTRRSRPARSACTPRARTSTPRWCRRTQIDPKIYGLTTIPLTDDPNAGVLAGGDIAAVNVKSTTPRSRRPPSAGSTSTTCRSCWTRTPRSTTPRPSPLTASPSAPRPCPSSTRPRSTSPSEWIKDYINVPARPDDRLHRRHLRPAAGAGAEPSTPRRCTRSWTPSSRRCSPTRTLTSMRS